MEFHDFVSEIDFTSDFNKIGINKLTCSQSEMLSHIHKNKFTIVYKRRQEGVSTALAIYLLWLLVKIPNYEIGMICFSKGERELFRQLINFNLNKLERIFEKNNINSSILKAENHNVHFTKLSNNSRITYMLPRPDAGRGHRLDLIYVSEASFGNNFMDMIQGIFMCLSGNGKIILTTTDLTNIKDDFFMNGDGITEFWCNSLFAGTRKVMIEKKLNSINFKF